MAKLKKGDIVQVMRGKDAGKKGEVLKMVYEQGVSTKVLVKGVNIVKRSQKPNPQLGIAGGITGSERAVDISNVMYFDEKSGKPSRLGIKIDEKTGKKIRFSKKGGAEI